MADTPQSAGLGTGLAQVVQPQGFDTLAAGVSNYLALDKERKDKAEEERKKQQAIVKKYQSDAAALKNDLLIPKLRNDLDKVNQEAYKEVERILIEDPNNISGAQRVITEAMNEAARFKQFQDEYVKPFEKDVAGGLVNEDIIRAQMYSDEVQGLDFDNYMEKVMGIMSTGKKKKSLQELSTEAQAIYKLQLQSGLRLAKEQEIRKAYPTASSVEITNMVDEAMANEIADNFYNQEQLNWDKLYPSREEAVNYIKTLAGDQSKVGLQTPKPTPKEIPQAGQTYSATQEIPLTERQKETIRDKEKEYSSLDPEKDKDKRAKLKEEIVFLKTPKTTEVVGRPYPDAKSDYTIVAGGQNISPRVIKKVDGDYVLEGVIIGEGQSTQFGMDGYSQRVSVSKGIANVKLTKEEQEKILSEWNKKNETKYKSIDELITNSQGQPQKNNYKSSVDYSKQ